MSRVTGPSAASAAVAKPRGAPEHPSLGVPRRDTIVTVVLAILTTTLFVLMADHVTRDAIQRIDDAFLRRMISIQAGWLTTIAKFFNLLGLVYVTLPVRLLIAGSLAFRRRWWHLSAFVSAIVLSEISIGTLKGLYDRARPMGSLVHTSGGSFPSGHAVAASVTAVAAVIALFPQGRGRFRWGIAAGVFSLVMGLSRAYLHAHWLSDAVAGVMLGTTLALGTALVVHLIRQRSTPAAGATVQTT
jgi:membrane-associated phospholipid phosphatase